MGFGKKNTTLNLRELYSIIHVDWILGPGQEDLQKNVRVGYKGSKPPTGHLPTGLWSKSSCSSLSLETLPLNSLHHGLSHLLSRPFSHNDLPVTPGPLRPLTCYVCEADPSARLKENRCDRSCVGCFKPISPHLLGFLGLILNLAVSSPGAVPTL